MTDDRTEVTDDLVLEVATRFGLRQPESWTVLSSSWTTNLHLTVDGQSWVARIHQPWTSRDRLAAIQSVRKSAHRAGLPTIVPLPDRNGDTIADLADGSLAELEPYVPWNRRMNTPELLARGFGVLGRLHDVLNDLDPMPAARTAPRANHLSSEVAAALTRQGARRISSWRDPMLSAFAGQVVAHVEAVATAEGTFAPAQVSQLVHGDFWDNNVLFADDDLAALIDFDFMAERWRIDDLALPIWFYLLEPGHGLPDEGDRRTVRTMVDSYDRDSARPLSEAERLCLPLAVARQPAWSVGRWVLTLDEPDAQRHAREAAAEFRVAAAVLADLDRWQDALTAVPRGLDRRTTRRP